MDNLKEIVNKYVGGQMEVQNQVEEYLYRGEIKEIAVENNEVKVKLNWNARGEGYPPLPKRWVKDDTLDYAASLQIYNVSDIGNGRISLFSPIVNEMVVLYPKDGSKLDPSKVEGLVLKVNSN